MTNTNSNMTDKIKALVWQISGPTKNITNDNYFDKLFELKNKLSKKCGYDLPELSILEGTEKPYILCVPVDFDPKSIFDEYGVKYYDDNFTDECKIKMFDLDKFNSNYQLGISYSDKDRYVLRKPHSNCNNINGIKINDDGYPIDDNNNIIEGSLKFPANHIDPKWNEVMKYNYQYSKYNSGNKDIAEDSD